MNGEPIERCELCGVPIADPPADTSGDVVCAECGEFVPVVIEASEVATT